MNCVLIILRGYFFRYEKVKTKSCFTATYFSSMFSISYQKYDLRSNPSHLRSFWTWVKSGFSGISVHASLHILFSPSQTNQTERTNSSAISEIILDKPTQEQRHKHKVQVTNTIRRQSIQLGTNKTKSQHRHATDGWREPCNLEWKLTLEVRPSHRYQRTNALWLRRHCAAGLSTHVASLPSIHMCSSLPTEGLSSENNQSCREPKLVSVSQRNTKPWSQNCSHHYLLLLLILSQTADRPVLYPGCQADRHYRLSKNFSGASKETWQNQNGSKADSSVEIHAEL